VIGLREARNLVGGNRHGNKIIGENEQNDEQGSCDKKAVRINPG